MNYWLLTTEYPPFFGGGISTYCYHTCCMLSAEGHNITVFVNDNNVRKFIIEQKKESRIIRFNPEHIQPSDFLGSTTQISYGFAQIVKKFIEDEGAPDIIESQDYNGIAYFLLQFKLCLAYWCRNVPVVITMHSPAFLYMEYNEAPIYKNPNFWIGEMEKFCIGAADLLISPSKYLVVELRKRFTIRNKIHIVKNPYIQEITEESSNDILKTDILSNKITFYGKLSPQKGTFKILAEFKKLWNKGFKESLLMVGYQGIIYYPAGLTMGKIIRKEYKPYIKSGLLHLHYGVSPEKREIFLKKSFLFIIPSIVDNLPYVALELMSLGKIVIVSKQGGQCEIISDNEDGFIFDYQQKTSFENTLKKVLNLTYHERKNISQRAQDKIIKNYSYESIYSVKIKLLEDLICTYQPRKHFPFIREIPTTIEYKNLASVNNNMLSVVIPYYNLGNYIDETIDSILNSTYTPIEIILINDGSNDIISSKKLDKYRNHLLIKVVDKENTGLANTRNYGASIAKGGFLAFLDADDVVTKFYYEKAICALSHYSNVHFVGAWTQYFGNSRDIWPTFNPEPPLILIQNTINSSSLVYKRQAFLIGGKNDISYRIGLEDYDSVIQMKNKGFNGIAIPEILFKYRVRKKSMITYVNQDIRAEYYKKIKTKYQNMFQTYNIEINNLIKNNRLPLMSDNSTLDYTPFQRLPYLNKIIRKFILIAKSNSNIKNAILIIKKINRK